MIRHHAGRLALGMALTSCSAVWAIVPSSTNFVLPSSTLNAGVGNMASVGFKLSSSLGDSTFTSAMTSTGFRLRAGFWGFVDTTPTTTVKQTVVEYVNTADFPNSPGGHFFYSSDPAEQAAVDAGAAGRFFRTGRQFFTGGTSPVCRFYGSTTPGPNSHFFTVDAGECNGLRALQITPTPTTVQQWNYERIEYSTTPASAITQSCPADTVPVYRAYNNAFPLVGPRNTWDSNHRYTPVQADITALVGQGWRAEGVVFCTAQ